MPSANKWLHGNSISSTQKGFTLLEVLIALSIVAITLTAALRASAAMTQQQTDLNLRLRAQWAADYQIAKNRLERHWPDIGQEIIECNQGGIPLICQKTITASVNPAFRLLEIAVFTDVSRQVRLAQLSVLISDGRQNLF